jgi:multidrug efflux pump subunit AcrA (membrane-fusion protein)
MRRWIPGAGFFFLAVGLWGQFGGFGGGGRGGGTDRAIPTDAVGRVGISDREFTTTVSGRLQPANTVAHSSSVGGVVGEVRVAVGQRVAVGDVLYTIRRSDGAGTYAPAVVAARLAGIVTTISVRPNNEVRSGEVGVSIIETGTYSMTALISDKDAFSVQIGRTVRGRTANGTSVRGTLLARSPEPDYQTGLFTLTFRFEGASELFPGQFVSVDLPVESVRGVFVPQDVLFRRYGRYYVWVVTPDNNLTAKAVTPGRTHEDDIQITSGLEPGERLLLQRRGNEREGQQVGGGVG